MGHHQPDTDPDEDQESQARPQARRHYRITEAVGTVGGAESLRNG
jgi:hypothetical protein